MNMSVVQRPHLTVLRGYTTTKATPSTFVRVRQRVHNRKLVCPQWARRAAQEAQIMTVMMRSNQR